MYCRNCGNEVTPQAVACVKCGYAPQNGQSFCPNCATPTGPGQAMCIKCGISLTPPLFGGVGVPGAKSKLVAGLLGIFLGGLGIHRFYLGYNNIAILQIILTFVTCGAASLWGFIEGILILAGNTITTDSDGVPLTN
jgi:hypothetical protein